MDDINKSTDQNFDVGYKKPPKHGQFKPGQSGNPSGKAKGAGSIRSKLVRLVAEEITIHENGVAKVVSIDEAMLKSVLMKAMKGDLASAKFIVELIGQTGATDSSVPAFTIAKADLDVLQSRADWVGIRAAAEAELEQSSNGNKDNDG